MNDQPTYQYISVEYLNRLFDVWGAPMNLAEVKALLKEQMTRITTLGKNLAKCKMILVLKQPPTQDMTPAMSQPTPNGQSASD